MILRNIGTRNIGTRNTGTRNTELPLTISFWQKDDLGVEIHCDVAVVGGGIVGCSTVYWLKNLDPSLNVALVESRTIGYGTSGRNAGFLLQGAAVDFVTDIERYGEDKADMLWRFTSENRGLIESELDPSRINLTPTGSLLLAGSSSEDERLMQSAELLRKRSVQAEYLSSDDVERDVKGIEFYGGLNISSGAGVHPLRLVREIAGTSGARVLEHHPVIDLNETTQGITLQTTRRQIHAQRVILALNAYLPQFLPETSSIIRPVRAQMLSTHPIPSWLNYPVYSHEGYYYLRQGSDGSLLLGGARHLFVDEETGYDDRTTPHLQQALTDYLNTHFPHTGPIRIERRWSGLMGFTENGLPIVNIDSDRYWWAAGFNGHGMGYGFRFGRLLAEMHLGMDTNGYEKLFTRG